jgi:uncharacterized protein (TIGR03000 family)
MSLRNLFFGSLLALMLAICLAGTTHGQGYYAGSVVNRYGIGSNYSFGNFGPYPTRPFSGAFYSATNSSFFYNPSNLNFPYTAQYYVPGRHPLQYSGNLYGPYALQYGTGLGLPYYGAGGPINSGQTTNIYNSPINTGSPNVNLSGQFGTQGYQSNYPPSGPLINPTINLSVNNGASTAPRPADVEVRVPSDAVLWFEGVRMKQTGSQRSFISPPLQPGKEYKYNVRIQWTENGQPVEQTRTIIVRAGEQVQVDFTQPEKQ